MFFGQFCVMWELFENSGVMNVGTFSKLWCHVGTYAKLMVSYGVHVRTFLILVHF